MVTAQTIPRVTGMRSYPAPGDFDDADPGSSIGLYARALWFDSLAWDTACFCESYATERYLRCDVPL